MTSSDEFAVVDEVVGLMMVAGIALVVVVTALVMVVDEETNDAVVVDAVDNDAVDDAIGADAVDCNAVDAFTVGGAALVVLYPFKTSTRKHSIVVFDRILKSMEIGQSNSKNMVFLVSDIQ